MALPAGTSDGDKSGIELAPQVLGASTNDTPSAASAASPAVQTERDAALLGWDFDVRELWGGGWEELVNEDAEQIGEAYEASILGGMIGVEDAEPQGEGMDHGFKEASGHTARGAEKAQKKISAKGMISNFVLSIIGSTTLGLAAQMKVCGWLLPPLMVIVGAAIVCENTRLVTATIDKMQNQDGIRVLAYPDFAKGAFGIWGKRVASVTSMCALLGMMCAFLVVESENFDYVLPITWPWFGCDHCGRKWWALFLTPVTTFYVFGNPGALLKKTAFLGPVVCMLTVILAWVGSGAAIASSSEIPDSCQTQRIVLPSMWQLFSASFILQLAQVGSYGFYGFAVISTVPTLRSQMKDPKKTAPAATFAYLIALLLFLPIMLIGYAGFGELVPENLIDGMRTERPAGWWALNRPFETGSITATGVCLDFSVTLNLVLTEAIYIPCTIMAIEASFPGIFRTGPPWTRKVMRVGFILFRFLVATEIQSFVAISALVSSLFCVCNNIIFPIVAFHWYEVKEVGALRKSIHAMVVLYGCFILILGTYSSIQAMSPHEEEAPGTFLRSDLSAECIAAFHQANRSGT